MNPEMMILEHLFQVLVFWAVCLVGWVTVKVIERHARVTSPSQKCDGRVTSPSQKCDGRVTPASQKCDANRGRRAA